MRIARHENAGTQVAKTIQSRRDERAFSLPFGTFTTGNSQSRHFMPG
jgi:hypothetical protein